MIIGVVVVPVEMGHHPLVLFPGGLHLGLPDREHIVHSSRVGASIDRSPESLNLLALVLVLPAKTFLTIAHVLGTTTVALLEPRLGSESLELGFILLTERLAQHLVGFAVCSVSSSAAVDSFLTESKAFGLGELLVLVEVVVQPVNTDEIEELPKLVTESHRFLFLDYAMNMGDAHSPSEYNITRSESEPIIRKRCD